MLYCYSINKQKVIKMANGEVFRPKFVVTTKGMKNKRKRKLRLKKEQAILAMRLRQQKNDQENTTSYEW